MDPLLDADARTLLAEERQLLERLHGVLERTGAEPETAAPLADMIAHLDALFLVVVVGEFNAGKSAVLNALFSEAVIEEGPIPTTAKIVLLRYGAEPLTRQRSEVLVERRYPADLLRHLTLVDTPGTNSIIQQHQKITEDFIPRSDLVLFVTSYDRPLAESERRFLSFIRASWGRQLVVVLNKIDLARDDEAVRQVAEHIRSGCEELLGFVPRLFPVSAAQAFAAKTEARDELWEASRFAALERFVTHTLAGPERLALKLTAPLETADRLLNTLGTHFQERLQVLADDQQTLRHLTQELETARDDLQADYQRHLSEVDNLLLQMEGRGVQFLSDTIRASVPKLRLLRDRDRFKEVFNRRVIADTDRQVEARVTEAVDDLLDRTTALQRRMYRTFAERVRSAAGEDRFVTEQAFSYDRAGVFRATMREAERKIEAHDLQREAGRLVDNASDAANLFLGAGAGAAGLGVLGVVLIAAPTLDALGGFGVFTGVALAAAGATILPRQRRKAIREFKERLHTLRTDLTEALTRQLDRQIDAALGSVRETIQPYDAFVQEEQTLLEDVGTEHTALRKEAGALRARVRSQYGTANLDA